MKISAAIHLDDRRQLRGQELKCEKETKSIPLAPVSPRHYFFDTRYSSYSFPVGLKYLLKWASSLSVVFTYARSG